LKLLSTWFPNPHRPINPSHSIVPDWMQANPETPAFFCFYNQTTTVTSPSTNNGPDDWTDFIDALPNQDLVDWGNCFTSINLLRILQKMCKRRMPRILTLASWRASAVLKRIVRMSQPTLQKYALKLIKLQLPFLGKKWRANNFLLWTMIYTEMRVDLREEHVLMDFSPEDSEAALQTQEWFQLMDVYLKRHLPHPKDEEVRVEELERAMEDWVWEDDADHFRYRPLVASNWNTEDSWGTVDAGWS
jgi:hypothetical protein